LPRSTDDFLKSEYFTSPAQLKKKIPNASPILVRKLETFLKEKRERPAITRTLHISTDKLGRTRYRDSKGRFVSSGYKKTRSRTYTVKKSKVKEEE
jgi:hypothetical protein